MTRTLLGLLLALAGLALVVSDVPRLVALRRLSPPVQPPPAPPAEAPAPA